MSRGHSEPVLLRPEVLAKRPPWARDIYLRRIAKGLTQAALARAIGMHACSIASYESGYRRPSVYSQGLLDAVLS